MKACVHVIDVERIQALDSPLDLIELAIIQRRLQPLCRRILGKRVLNSPSYMYVLM